MREKLRGREREIKGIIEKKSRETDKHRQKDRERDKATLYA